MNGVGLDWSQVARASTALDVYLLGLVEQAAAVGLQEHLVNEIASRGDRKGYLLVCEHPPVITIGREGSRAQLHDDPESMAQRGIATSWTNRGGRTWLHLPGQLMLYLVLPAERMGLDPFTFREQWLQALSAACVDLQIPTQPSADGAGLEGRQGMLAFLGAAIRDGVSAYGAVLNVAPPTGGLDLVDWTGDSGRVSSISAHRGRPATMASVREAVIRQLAHAFGYLHYHVSTAHPLLRRARRKVASFEERIADSAPGGR